MIRVQHEGAVDDDTGLQTSRKQAPEKNHHALSPHVRREGSFKGLIDIKMPLTRET